MTTNIIFVVNHPREFPCAIPGADVVSASTYLTDPAYGDGPLARVVNLCRADRYQGRGYYVSLLAEARGHQPLPNFRTIRDLQTGDIAHLLNDESMAPIRQTLASCQGDRCDINAYFGRDAGGASDPLRQQLFSLLRVPLVRAAFERRDGTWRLCGMRILSAADIPDHNRTAVANYALEYMSANGSRLRKPSREGPSIAILHNDDEPDPPSNPKALQKFLRAADALGMRAEIIGRGDIDRLFEFEALFIRDTTGVDHYTYEFSRRAVGEGLVVVDDPESILKCMNKVYLNELLARHHVPMPKTLTVHRRNVDQIIPLLGLPCILKKPDSAFSLGVEKVDTAEALHASLDKLLARSDLVIAQEWLPTSFDWRVGVFDGRPMFVCKYFMAPGHWQVIKRERNRRLEGTTTAQSIGETPEIVIRTALQAANLIGNGLYGVDLKQANNQCYVIEVNDNPNIDAGNEDGVLRDALYREVMGVFLRRIQEREQVVATQ